MLPRPHRLLTEEWAELLWLMLVSLRGLELQLLQGEPETVVTVGSVLQSGESMLPLTRFRSFSRTPPPSLLLLLLLSLLLLASVTKATRTSLLLLTLSTAESCE